MELGQKLKQARLEAGLSQRQLCGERISRNMLSLIENGSAKPSMDTLRYLAQKLGKPLSYFLEDTAVTSPNQDTMAAARESFRNADYSGALKALEGYRGPDDVFDGESALIGALASMCQAEKALAESKHAYAEALLEKAREFGSRTPYYTADAERRRLLLAYTARPAGAGDLAPSLPDNTQELLLRAHYALDSGDPKRCLQLLDAAQEDCSQAHFLRGEACLALGEFSRAADSFLAAQALYPRQSIARLEQCYRELGDYEKAYFYACKQREF